MASPCGLASLQHGNHKIVRLLSWLQSSKSIVSANKAALFVTPLQKLHSITSPPLYWSKWSEVCQQEGCRLCLLMGKEFLKMLRLGPATWPEIESQC